MAERTELGLPETGSGSLAPTGARVLGFVVDLLVSFLAAFAFTAPHLPGNVSLLVFGCEYVFFQSVLSQTPGMLVARIRVIRVDRPAPVGLYRSVIRTVLLILLIPAIIWDGNGRGLHDRASQTVVVRT